MAFTNSISAVFPSLGHPFLGGVGESSWRSLGNAVATVGAPQTITLTFPSSVTLTRGRWRIKFYNTTNTPTVIAKAHFSDGTSKLDVLLPTAAFTPTDETQATSGVELGGQFVLDINATSFVVVVTLAGGGGTGSVDVEVFGQQ